ncbi:hypothetical protein LQ327_09455 [Actinomycetospora endophytica]|uniref:Trypsin-co-occurring domain-containing protein n=1 Tax=Actinomycetospora endophytica TaxID=2291215 RepID=A0ABS8P5S2_9PSEU|nr:trypco2 family protein [Actinomycetospora endophytica]MCD2193606.1 hypothetical protein [Actinomycetospora endophytica]
MAIEVAELISQLRSELNTATETGKKEDLRFELGPIELELNVGVDKEAKPGAKVRFWVVELGADAKLSSTNTQKIKLTLQPRRTSQAGRKPDIAGDEVPGELDDEAG